MILFELKRLALMMRSWTFTLVGVTVLFVVMFPYMGESGLLSAISQKLDIVPDFVIRMFGLAEKPDFTKFPAYFNLCEYFLQVKLCIVAALMGCESLIEEETDGTIEFLYAMPHSRLSIVIAKFVSRVMMILILNALYLAVAYCGFRYMNEPATTLFRSFASALMPQLSYLMIGMLISTLLSSSTTASTTSMSLFLVTFLLGIIPWLMGKWYKLEYLSPNTAITRADFMSAGFRPYWPQIKITAIYSFSALGLAGLIYCRKDMKLQ